MGKGWVRVRVRVRVRARIRLKLIFDVMGFGIVGVNPSDLMVTNFLRINVIRKHTDPSLDHLIVRLQEKLTKEGSHGMDRTWNDDISIKLFNF